MNSQALRVDQLAFRYEPIFCFTTDIDWAPEWAISEILGFFEENRLPLTPFVTHESSAIRERFAQGDMSRRVGVHPNFLPFSTHGSTPSEVVDFVQRLWPQAISFRSHAFFDNTGISYTFRRRGFKYDSNLCLFLQAGCVPLQHCSGMVRFPVFWSDDAHFYNGLPMDAHMIEEDLDEPGLKVVNIHPFQFALNIPSGAYYYAHKHLFNKHDTNIWRDDVWPEKGTRTFVEGVVDFVKAKSYPTEYLYDLFLRTVREAPAT